MGCGVSATDLDDAEALLRESLFDGDLPTVRRVVEDLDVRDLDENHVRPNMGDPSVRGVWFPAPS